MLYLNNYDIYKNRRIFDGLSVSESYTIKLETIRIIEPEKYQDRKCAAELHLLITDEKLSEQQLRGLKNLLETYYFDVNNDSKKITVALYSRRDFSNDNQKQLSFSRSLKRISYETLIAETKPIKKAFKEGKEDKKLIKHLKEIMQDIIENISKDTLHNKPNFYKLTQDKIPEENVIKLYKIANHYHHLTMNDLKLTNKLYDCFTDDEKKIIEISDSYRQHYLIKEQPSQNLSIDSSLIQKNSSLYKDIGKHKKQIKFFQEEAHNELKQLKYRAVENFNQAKAVYKIASFYDDFRNKETKEKILTYFGIAKDYYKNFLKLGANHIEKYDKEKAEKRLGKLQEPEGKYAPSKIMKSI